MLKFYSWTTPNGRKISIALEEMGIAYQAIPIDIKKGDQFTPEFLAIRPNNKIPVIVDEDGTTIFESGAILLYLAEKSGKFMPQSGSADYWQVMQWLMWQKAGFGPMLGQAHHFLHFNKGKSDYAEARFSKEANRLYRVLNTHLEGRSYIGEALSIADFAIWPWVSRFEFQQIDLKNFPAVHDWYLSLAERPGFIRGYAQPMDSGPIPV